MRFVPIKADDQLDLQAIHRVRDRLIARRTASCEPEYTLRAVNYILGTHPVSSTSYVAGVGTVSKTKTYINNRADNAYIPGAVIPGYIIIKPDFPECIDDFGFLWFEDEAVVAGSASWVVAGNAAAALTKELK